MLHKFHPGNARKVTFRGSGTQSEANDKLISDGFSAGYPKVTDRIIKMDDLQSVYSINLYASVNYSGDGQEDMLMTNTDWSEVNGHRIIASEFSNEERFAAVFIPPAEMNVFNTTSILADFKINPQIILQDESEVKQENPVKGRGGFITSLLGLLTLLACRIVGIYSYSLRILLPFLPIPLSIIGIALSGSGLSKIRRNPDHYKGKWLGIAGLIIGIFTLITGSILLTSIFMMVM